MTIEDDVRIDIATGVVMARQGVDAAEALALIIAVADHVGRARLDVAEELIRTHGFAPDLTV